MSALTIHRTTEELRAVVDDALRDFPALGPHVERLRIRDECGCCVESDVGYTLGWGPATDALGRIADALFLLGEDGRE